MNNLIPQAMSYAELANVLIDMAERARTGDSFEGFISYTIPDLADGHDPDHQVEVAASYRFGNLMGQGSMRIIGTIP